MISDVIYIEPFGGGKGKHIDDGVRLALVSKGNVKFLDSNWMNLDGLSDDECKALLRCVDRSKRWIRPTANLPESYAKYVRMYEGITDCKTKEEYRDKVQDLNRSILSEIFWRIVRCISTFIRVDDDREYLMLATFCILSFFRDQFTYSPAFTINGVSGSGKSSVLEVLSRICYRGRKTHDYSAASLYDSIEKDGITLLLDEVLNGLSSTTRGSALRSLLLGVVDPTSVVDRMNSDNDDGIVRRIGTMCAVTVKGTSLDEDLFNRCYNMSMPLVDPDPMKLGIAYSKYLDLGCNGSDPDSIRDDLYALKLINL